MAWKLCSLARVSRTSLRGLFSLKYNFVIRDRCSSHFNAERAMFADGKALVAKSKQSCSWLSFDETMNKVKQVSWQEIGIQHYSEDKKGCRLCYMS